MTDLVVDAGWALGLLAAMTRVAGFVVSSPFTRRAIPVPGRMALVLALGLFLAEPVSAPTVGDLVTVAVANLTIGLVLGFLTGIVFHLFEIAGAVIDFTSGLSAATILDPLTGTQNAVFARAFNLAAITAFFLIGGDRLLVEGLGLSVAAIGLDGAIDLDAGLADLALGLFRTMLVAAIELSVPALAALFMAELVMGLAARFAPQANVFLLGLPVKILAAFATVTLVVLAFPEAVDGIAGGVADTFRDALRGLMVSG